MTSLDIVDESDESPISSGWKKKRFKEDDILRKSPYLVGGDSFFDPSQLVD